METLIIRRKNSLLKYWIRIRPQCTGRMCKIKHIYNTLKTCRYRTHWIRHYFIWPSSTKEIYSINTSDWYHSPLLLLWLYFARCLLVWVEFPKTSVRFLDVWVVMRKREVVGCYVHWKRNLFAITSAKFWTEEEHFDIHRRGF